MTKVFHGGDLSSVRMRYPNAQAPWVDLSTGLNPNAYPWLESVSEQKLTMAADKLPQQNDEEKCKSAWLNYLGAENPEEWLLVSGSQAFINIIPRLFPDHLALIPMPNYGEHERVWHSAEKPYIKISRQDVDKTDFKQNTLVILTNPNNPDGYVWPKEYLIELSEKLEKNGGILIVDEAFADVLNDNSLVTMPLPDNIIIMRSFGKFFGLGGVRLGMVRLPTKIYKKAVSEIGPWSVNGLALIIAEHALKDNDWVNDALRRISANMEQLIEILIQARFKIIGYTDLFCLVEHSEAQKINKKLNEKGIFVRVFKDNPTRLRFGLPKDSQHVIRIKEALK